MKGCSTHYHETLGLTDSVDTKLIELPKKPLREYREDVEELVSSIKEKGLVQPIVVRPTGGMFEVVAGARRLKACRRLRWLRIPCIIRNLSDEDAYEMSLTENIQRKTMNALEEAAAFKTYVNQKGWGGESNLARKIGKSQEYVSQRLSLLSLPKSVKEKIIRHQINPSVAGEIARLPDKASQIALSERAAKEHLTVTVIREATQSIKTGESLDVAVQSARLNRKELPVGSPSRIRLPRDLVEPEFFGMKLGVKDSIQPEFEQLDNGVLILKLALLRLSTLVGSLPKESDVWEILVEKRFLIHGMIDSLIKAKVKMNRRLAVAVSGV